MDKTYSWAWFGLAVFIVVGAAYMFRYSPIRGSIESAAGIGMSVEVWDRWQAKPCTVGIYTDNKFICSMSDAKALGEQRK